MTGAALTTRPATRDDLDAVTGIACAGDAAVRGLVVTTPDDVLRDWDEPGFDLAAGTLVLEDDGRVVGNAVRSGRDADSVADLSLRDAEERLLAWLEAFVALALLHESFARHRARGLPATVLGVDAGNPTGALALYEKAGHAGRGAVHTLGARGRD